GAAAALCGAKYVPAQGNVIKRPGSGLLGPPVGNRLGVPRRSARGPPANGPPSPPTPPWSCSDGSALSLPACATTLVPPGCTPARTSATGATPAGRGDASAPLAPPGTGGSWRCPRSRGSPCTAAAAGTVPPGAPPPAARCGWAPSPAPAASPSASAATPPGTS